jgi:3-oxoacyl-[acyl-carrier-protein] synthase II
MNVDVALRCMATGLVPPIAGLRDPIGEAATLRLVQDRPARADVRLAQINSFGFGGVNAVTLIQAA